MKGSSFDELQFFREIQDSGARSLLIGRRALVILGLPVLTADYDFWIHIDDIAAFNGALTSHEFEANRSPEEARRRGRYVLENDERIDVLVARSVPTVDGRPTDFEDLWSRRVTFELKPGITVQLPSLADLITTKRFAARPKDLEDIRLLESLRDGEKP